MRNIGRGPNISLKRLYEKDEEGSIISTYLDRSMIESKLMEYNRNYYHKVMQINAFKDKIHNKLQNDNIRNKILSSTLTQDECDIIEIHEFLSLLKKTKL